MRILVSALLVIAACTDEGAHLTFSAPDGPATATTYQLVLASPDLVPVIGDQRVAPKGLSTETVTYYLQRTSTGVTSDQGSIDHADGFTVLVEPNATIADTTFIPFLVLYDSSQHVVGMGTFHATPSSTDPGQILVQRGQVDRYTIDIEAVAEVTDADPVDTQQAMQVNCTRDDQSTFQSGVVWRPASGGEIRLMLPDDPTSTDATQRKLDMDCDEHEVMVDDASADCDDTRARFHAGATELCDGENWSCDSMRYLVQSCTGTGTCSDGTTSDGFTLCDDSTGTMSDSCTADVACACAGGNTTGCHKCSLAFVQGSVQGEVAPCQPGLGAISTMDLCSNGPCTVNVAAIRGGWDVTVSSTSNGTFGPIATGIMGSGFAIKVARPEGPGVEIMGVPAGSVGSVDLVIVSSIGVPTLMSFDLELDADHSTCTGNGPFSMACN